MTEKGFNLVLPEEQPNVSMTIKMDFIVAIGALLLAWVVVRLIIWCLRRRKTVVAFWIAMLGIQTDNVIQTSTTQPETHNQQRQIVRGSVPDRIIDIETDNL